MGRPVTQEAGVQFEEKQRQEGKRQGSDPRWFRLVLITAGVLLASSWSLLPSPYVCKPEMPAHNYTWRSPCRAGSKGVRMGEGLLITRQKI